jgi:hypothetical protein
MKKVNIHIGQLKEYIDSAFFGDEELIGYYDKGEQITSIPDACENVFLKIKGNYPEATMIGLEIQGESVGYFVYNGTLLVSFGLALNKRTKDNLLDFWGCIKETVGPQFQSILYSYNDRAIGFLKKCGMDIIFDNVTILQYN